MSRDHDHSNVTEEHTHTTSPTSRKYFCSGLTWPGKGCWGRGTLKVCRESVIINLVVSTLFIIAVTTANSVASLADGQRDMRPGFSQDGKVTSLPSCFCKNESPLSAYRSARNFG